LFGETVAFLMVPPIGGSRHEERLDRMLDYTRMFMLIITKGGNK